jgi:hypothetical protein
MADGAFPEIEQFSRAGGLGNPLGGALGGTSVEVDMGELAVEVRDDGKGGQIIAVTAPAVHTHDYDDEEFDANLAEDGRVAEGILTAVADELLQGVEADEMTRSDLIRQYQSGLELLTNKNEEPGTSQSQARSTITQINHPLLTEAMVKYHSGALAEMIPAEGPVKVATTGQVSSEEEEAAQDFSDMFNYFLMDIATEWYDDTSQMLMHQAYCGNGYKKIYRCPMRMRPVSESVRMIDLIVSEEATSLDNALRVTHQFFPSRAELKRMMILGKYRNFTIPYSSMQTPLGVRALKRSEGLAPQAMRPQDAPLHLYECDMSLDPEFFDIGGKYEREAPEGLPLPYKVTVHKDTREVLGIWRNWEDGDDLYLKNNMYVRYGLIQGLGFHKWGFLQLLGNQTRALRAIWRLLIDSGMFSNFPGGVKIKGARTSTNEIRPGPGEWVDIDVPGSTDIRSVLMPLPYKQLDAVFVQFAQMIQDSAQKLGGMVELEVGEGRTNVPVGTIMSQIEQSTQIMAAVHKGNHNSQKDEIHKLRKLFAKFPEDLWRLNPNPARRYQTAAEFMDLNLQPASDPNIPAQASRIMQIWALLTLVQQSPAQFDIQEVLRRALSAIRIADPKTVLLSPEQQAAAAANAPPPAAPPPDPAKLAMAQAKITQGQQQHEGKMQEIQADAANQQHQTSVKANAAALESADRQADRNARLQEAAMRASVDRDKIAADFAKSQQPPPAPEGGTASSLFGG